MMATPGFQFLQTPGPFSVGLKVVEQYDYSRVYRHATDAMGLPYRGERARPLQTLIWYPALRREGTESMKVSDYVKLWATETSFGIPSLSWEARQSLTALAPTFTSALWAVIDASPAPDRFPVVIYAPSFSAVAWENADLCEYLASHGYVVIASPSMGAASRPMTQDLVGINTQARDISFLIAYAHSLPNTNPAAIGVVAFSWGGISNVFAAARDNRIGAVVVLDGSIRYFPGLVERAGDVHPERMTTPLLSFAQRYRSRADDERYSTSAERDGPNVIDAWIHADVLDVHMLGMTHAEFSSMLQRNEDMWWKLSHVFPLMKGDSGREDGSIGYGWVARYTLEFLDAYVKHDASAAAFLKNGPAENEVPRHVMTSAFRGSSGLSASVESFRAEIGRLGFDHLAPVYESIRKNRPDFILEESALAAWSDELIDGGRLPEAIALLRFNVHLWPHLSAAHMRLSRAYEHSGRIEEARASCRAALERDPMNADAKLWHERTGLP